MLWSKWSSNCRPACQHDSGSGGIDNGEIERVNMLNSTKRSAPDKDRSAGEVILRAVQLHDQAWARSEPRKSELHDQRCARSEPTTTAGTTSCIGSDMSIVGKIESNGPAQVFGRIEGELRASDLQISDGAQVEGTVIAQNVTVCGRVKGMIQADRVRLQNGGVVEGDIFHRILSVDENSQFEGSSRRVENPTDQLSSVDGKGPQKSLEKKNMAPSPSPSAETLEGLAKALGRAC
jgi:cytoskeletal protein CcmA (bactofilin family)